jgi:Sulfate permease family
LFYFILFYSILCILFYFVLFYLFILSIYFIRFTTSKHISVGPFAIISLLVGEGNFFLSLFNSNLNTAVSQYLGSEKGDVTLCVNVTILLTFMCGIIKIVFGIIRCAIHFSTFHSRFICLFLLYYFIFVFLYIIIIIIIIIFVLFFILILFYLFIYFLFPFKIWIYSEFFV